MAIELTGLPSASATSNGETTQANSSSKSGLSANSQGGSEISSPKVTSTDSVTLTRSAVNLSMIEADINAQSEIDDKRVESLKLAIETGQYDFNPTRVAEKFLLFEMQL